MLMIRVSVASFALVFAAVPTLAQPIVVEGGVPTATVSYADLNLNSAAGRFTLERRVARAASNICTEDGRKSLEQEQHERRCVSTALSRAKSDIEEAISSAAARMASRSSITLAAK